MRFVYISPFGAFGLSHFGPFVPVAEALRERGHEVCFVSTETPPALQRLGFECRIQTELGIPEERLDLLPPESFLDGGLDRAFGELEADRFVVDGAIGFLCLFLAKLKRPSVRFQITLPLDDRPVGWSPLDAPRQFHGGSQLARWRVGGQWLGRSWSRRWMSWRIAMSRALRRSSSWTSPLSFHRQLAVAAKLDPAIVHHRGTQPGFRWPEIIAGEEQFARGFPASELRRFAGNLVMDWGVIESGFDWGRLREEAPLVYCSFGSNSGAWQGLTSFVQLLVETCRRLPNWDFVFAGAERWRRELGTALPPNLLAVEFAPQLEVLARASVFVTHGGMSSVREARHHGVPMWVLPITYDQFGNAARLTHLGWARSGTLDRLPSPENWATTLLQLEACGRASGDALLEVRGQARRDLESVVELLQGSWAAASIENADRVPDR